MSSLEQAIHLRSRLRFGKAPVSPPPRTTPFGTIAPGNTRAISLVTAAAVIGLWVAATSEQWVTPLFLPSPWAVARQVVVVWNDGFAGFTLAEHIWASLSRVLIALGLVLVTAIPLGLGMGLNRWAKGVADPLIDFYWPLPPLAYLPLIIIWLGIDETAKIVLIFLSMFAPVAIAAQAGVRSVSVERIQAAYTLGASRWKVFVHVIARGALPEILTGVRIAIGAGWSTLVAAELVASNKGIGFMIISASRFLVMDVALMGLLVIAVLAISFLYLMKVVESVLTPWKGKT
jgi:taurine transport system permease protein